MSSIVFTAKRKSFIHSNKRSQLLCSADGMSAFFLSTITATAVAGNGDWNTLELSGVGTLIWQLTCIPHPLPLASAIARLGCFEVCVCGLTISVIYWFWLSAA